MDGKDEMGGVSEDQAPGESEKSKTDLRNYIVGFGLAVFLTLASFWAAGTDLVWAPAIPVLLGALAIGQMGVHLVFFLHISSAPDSTNNILALVFGTFVVALVVFGSMLIMHNLNANMIMNPQHMMDMQR